ncbi:hypothetical protein IFM89_018559 [Coptis chinensis]|uniref:Uncharacterized protein n=1 Tax=Coptis chinensis TaxID=261450 RepID=A0A835IC24_9MAGN|nr:hypothetical protein IFM89_018559 [Coptis chinensis]
MFNLIYYLFLCSKRVGGLMSFVTRRSFGNFIWRMIRMYKEQRPLWRTVNCNEIPKDSKPWEQKKMASPKINR